MFMLNKEDVEIVNFSKTSLRKIFLAQSIVPVYIGAWPAAGRGIVCRRTYKLSKIIIHKKQTAFSQIPTANRPRNKQLRPKLSNQKQHVVEVQILFIYAFIFIMHFN